MSRVAYTVAVTFEDGAMAEKWLNWLAEGHIDAVLAGGATDAEVIALDGPGRAFEVRYHFASRQAFDEYEQRHAPALRAEGLKLFPTERGVTYRRSVGVVEVAFPPGR